MTRVIAALIATAVVSSGCASISNIDSVPDIGLRAANYTEDYIHDFYLETVSGTRLKIGGVNVKQFSKGGARTGDCCATLPGVGRKIKVLWRTGGYNDPESAWINHDAVVKITGETVISGEAHTYLVIRFFANDQIEAEYIAQSLTFGSERNPRSDLLFTGRRVMRRPGE